ncbi:MAG: maltose alpha-D-glucosyltransferase [Planctomycetes bacterium]|nr:maltose alpha-D-glucosyltransferase [Planctomycetota bacterium]
MPTPPPLTATASSDPLWYKDAVLYELPVKAFQDSTGDGIGDFRGLLRRLDYLQDLGVTALWLLPFYPSPQKDDGYDIADYFAVHPAYGTLADFKEFLAEAHRRDLRVITELVINHTSDQNAWFQRARRARPGSKSRDYYVWSDTPERYQGVRVIFPDYEPSNWTWDPVAKAYYWHRFFHHQPDLNFDNPAVHEAIHSVLDFWMGLGVDGMRLDAIPYLYEREGTSCENLPEVHAFLKGLRRHLDTHHPGRMLLAEANLWPEDAVAYFGAGDEAHMNFHFPVMPRMFLALRLEDRTPIVDILEQTPPIPETCQWATFLRNHDELTLEMVTEEERDLMWRVYAQERKARLNLGIRRRLAPLVGNDRRQIELLNLLLFTLTGTPVLYYGDEIGMGDNVHLGDRHSVRTPMQWSPDRNAGFSTCNPQALYLPVVTDPEYHYETVNVENQQRNPHSLLWWTKRMIATARRHKAFGRGSLTFLHPENRKVLAYLRRHGDECLLVVANLSRSVQHATLDLRGLAGRTPIELSGATHFPTVGAEPYPFTLAPYGCYWFVLEARAAGAPAPAFEAAPRLGADSLEGLFAGRNRGLLERHLVHHLPRCPWFQAQGRRVRDVRLREGVLLRSRRASVWIAFASVEFSEGEPGLYQIPFTFLAAPAKGAPVQSLPPEAVHLRAGLDGSDGHLVDAAFEREAARLLMAFVARKRRVAGAAGELVGRPAATLRAVLAAPAHGLEPVASRIPGPHTAVAFGQSCILKLYRKVERGVHPDVELHRHLAEAVRFPHVPPFGGEVRYESEAGAITLGMVEGYVASVDDGVALVRGQLASLFRDALSTLRDHTLPLPEGSLLAQAEAQVPEIVRAALGPHLALHALLGQRVAELHVALANDAGDPAFAPEEYTPFYQRSLYQSVRNVLRAMLDRLRRELGGMAGPWRDLAEAVVARESTLLEGLRALTRTRIASRRIRIHGDLHLGRLLFTGKDFVFRDFAGEPGRSQEERRILRSPLRDVACLLRSVRHASQAALRDDRGAEAVRAEDIPLLAPWAHAWARWCSAAMLGSWLAHAGPGGFLPADPAHTDLLLRTFLHQRLYQEIAGALEGGHRPGTPLPALAALAELEGLPVPIS